MAWEVRHNGVDGLQSQEIGAWRVRVTIKMKRKFAKPGSFLKLAYSAPPPDDLHVAEIRRYTLPATKALPFVKLRANDQPMWRPESYWHVRPTGKRKLDVQIGREYAREAIAAMKADRNGDLIALIVQDIVKDAVDQTGKKGRSVQNPIVLGFLAEISGALAAAFQNEVAPSR
jgi:hypothetical protein